MVFDFSIPYLRAVSRFWKQRKQTTACVSYLEYVLAYAETTRMEVSNVDVTRLQKADVFATLVDAVAFTSVCIRKKNSNDSVVKVRYRILVNGIDHRLCIFFFDHSIHALLHHNRLGFDSIHLQSATQFAVPPRFKTVITATTLLSSRTQAYNAGILIYVFLHSKPIPYEVEVDQALLFQIQNKAMASSRREETLPSENRAEKEEVTAPLGTHGA
jgi:hypothetical protein